MSKMSKSGSKSLKHGLKQREYRPFKCDLCDKSYLQKNHLTHHMFKHNPLSLKCSYCDKIWTNERALQRHELIHEFPPEPRCKATFPTSKTTVTTTRKVIATPLSDAARPFECETCQKTYKNQNHLDQHMLVHQPKMHKCDDCDKLFHTISSLHRHQRTHEARVLIKCSLCESQVLDLKTHMKHHNERYTCQTCGKVFSRKDALNVHQRIHTGIRPYKCAYCNNSYRVSSHLKQHEESTHALEDSKDFNGVVTLHICSFCGRSFRSSSKLASHVLIHTAQPRFLCEACGKTFRTTICFKDHLLWHKGMRPHKCPNCPRTFLRRSALNVHMVEHSNALPIECPDCGERFKRRGHLITHRGKVHDDQKHICTYCGRRFTHYTSLTNHVRTHLGLLKPFKCTKCCIRYATKETLSKHKCEPIFCELCGSVFKSRKLYGAHMARHRNKSHMCTVCSKSFTSSYILGRHMLFHTGERPHRCDHENCTKAFRTPAQLNQHKRQKNH